MGCGESKSDSGIELQDFQLEEDGEAQVDRESIPFVWKKKFRGYELSDEDLNRLVPDVPITEENADDKFADFKDKFMKLGHKKKRLEEMKEKPMPYLDQYFNLYEEQYKKAVISVNKKFWKGYVPNQAVCESQRMLEDLQNEMQAWYDSIGKPLIKKSFDYHDLDGDGILDEEESTIFFEHLMEGQMRSSTRLAHRVMMITLQAYMREVPLPWWAKMIFESLIRAVTKQTLEPLVDQLKTMHSEQLEAYKASKDTKNKAAFALLDKNKDGFLDWEDVCVFLTPMSTEHDNFFVSLGFHDSENKECLEKIVKNIFFTSIGNRTNENESFDVSPDEPFQAKKKAIAEELERTRDQPIEERRRIFKDLMFKNHPDKNSNSDESVSVFQYLQAQKDVYLYVKP
eukprot:gnl/MRDRNA2_/MRDRNA2_118057_c0_seq1.p1 gnl/MRDRNA2_/MRDRNA2_118057_c0~~gnl/MRDRNA2_/MRDRNA2_118057_c0_seq1.p1  ORF type:complete len:399 (+),score=83.97 gnl/MRDRNA2_/MRDRNA2_118057_c0_seq1:69-1265(+)